MNDVISAIRKAQYIDRTLQEKITSEKILEGIMKYAIYNPMKWYKYDTLSITNIKGGGVNIIFVSDQDYYLYTLYRYLNSDLRNGLEYDERYMTKYFTLAYNNPTKWTVKKQDSNGKVVYLLTMQDNNTQSPAQIYISEEENVWFTQFQAKFHDQTKPHTSSGGQRRRHHKTQRQRRRSVR